MKRSILGFVRQMAVFGTQAVVSLILLSFLQKICPIYSLGRWLLTKQNLVRYLHPTNEELKQISGGHCFRATRYTKYEQVVILHFIVQFAMSQLLLSLPTNEYLAQHPDYLQGSLAVWSHASQQFN